MRISKKKPGGYRVDIKKYNINQHIKAPEVRLIDEAGQNIGTIATNQALAMAQDRGLDLVEVSPLANPPVAKIIDYSKLKYQEEKERRKEKSKQKKIEIKGLRLSLRIGQGDIEVRVRQAVKFLTQGDKVRIEMLLRGRERQHADLAREIIKKFIEAIGQEVEVVIEEKVSMLGGKLTTLINKK